MKDFTWNDVSFKKHVEDRNHLFNTTYERKQEQHREDFVVMALFCLA